MVEYGYPAIKEHLVNKIERNVVECGFPAIKEHLVNKIERNVAHIPMPNLDHDQSSGAQNDNLQNEMLKERGQQDQKRHDPQHQN